MPTILRIGPYRFFFFSSDGHEPLHVHVERDDMAAKFWIDPIRLHDSGGFNRSELVRIQQVIEENQSKIVEAWHEFFQQ
jgi:hypothetical protein